MSITKAEKIRKEITAEVFYEIITKLQEVTHDFDDKFIEIAESLHITDDEPVEEKKSYYQRKKEALENQDYDHITDHLLYKPETPAYRVYRGKVLSGKVVDCVKDNDKIFVKFNFYQPDTDESIIIWVQDNLVSTKNIYLSYPDAVLACNKK